MPALAARRKSKPCKGAGVRYEWLVRVKNRSGKAAAGLYLKFKQPRSGDLVLRRRYAWRSSSIGKVVVATGWNGDDFGLLPEHELIAPDEEVRFSMLSSNGQLEFERGRWTSTKDVFSSQEEQEGSELSPGDVLAVRSSTLSKPFAGRSGCDRNVAHRGARRPRQRQRLPSEGKTH